MDEIYDKLKNNTINKIQLIYFNQTIIDKLSKYLYFNTSLKTLDLIPSLQFNIYKLGESLKYNSSLKELYIDIKLHIDDYFKIKNLNKLMECLKYNSSLTKLNIRYFIRIKNLKKILKDKFKEDFEYNYYLRKLYLDYKELYLDYNEEMMGVVFYDIFFNKNNNKIYIKKIIDVDGECCNSKSYYIDKKILDLDFDFDLDKIMFYIENSSPLDYLNI